MQREFQILAGKIVLDKEGKLKMRLESIEAT
jgi:hypothetical protein